MASEIIHLTADEPGRTNAVLADTGLSFPVLAGTFYTFRFHVSFRSSSTAVGLKLGLTFPQAANFSAAVRTIVLNGANALSSGEVQGQLFASGDSVTTSGVPTANANYLAVIEGVILPAADGTLTVQYAAETTGATVTLMRGSSGELIAGATIALPPPLPQVTVEVLSTTVLASYASPFDWNGRAVVARRPSDNAGVMVYRSAASHTANNAVLHIRFRAAGSCTWTADDTTLAGDPVVGFPMNPGEGNIGIGDAVLYVAPSGRLVMHMWSCLGAHPNWTWNGTWQSESEDGGHTWTTPHGPVEFVITGATASTHSRTFATDQGFNIGPDMYAGARIYPTSSGYSSGSMILIRSSDDGDNWVRVSLNHIMALTENGSGGQEVGLTRIGATGLVAQIRDNPQTKSFRRFSSDIGLTWGALSDITSMIGVAGRQRIYTAAQLRGELNWENDPNHIMCGFETLVPGNSQTRRNQIWISQDASQTMLKFPVDTNSYGGDGGYGDIFHVSGDEYGFISYRGSLDGAELVQYNLRITGV